MPQLQQDSRIRELEWLIMWAESQCGKEFKNGFIYYFKWEELDLIPASFTGIPRTLLKECISCSKTLTFENRSSFFSIDLGYGTKDTYIFTSIRQASRETGISICALRNACSKVNTSIMK